MKQIIISIFNLLLFLPGYCQVSWFPIGAKWHYEFSSMIGGGLTTLEVLSEDTLIGNHTYKKIISTTMIGSVPGSIDTFTEFLYVFEENQVVVGYDKWLGGTLLYDFNAAVGDTLGMYFGGISPYPFVVDSIGELEINGSMLSFQDIRFPSLFDPGEFYEMRVIEEMGSISSHLFHDHTVLQPFDFPSYYFRCYEDSNIGLINLSFNQVDCDYIDGITFFDEAIKVKTSIFPNPSANFVTLKTESPQIVKVFVIDILGTNRIVKHSTNQELIKIDISELENGLYFILGLNKKGEVIFTEKITKYGS
jgi:hypothetical protein